MPEDTFGNRLRSERTDRGLSVEAVADILGAEPDRLLALERNEFEALPDEGVMRDWLHAYARCLQVDADLMIADYDRERDRWLRRQAGVLAEEAAAAGRRSRFSRRLLALVVVAIALGVGWWVLSRGATAPAPRTSVLGAAIESRPLSPPPPAVPAPDEPQALPPPAPVVSAPVEPRPLPPQTPAPAAPAPTPVTPPAARSAPTTPAPSTLRIRDYGVGTAVENRRLVGRSDRFSEGTRVWFWTRVERGTRGDRIDHVWLREGVEAQRISLEIGGSSWRTHSAMTLQAGAAGDWAVEARDGAGRVLARSEFVCVP